MHRNHLLKMQQQIQQMEQQGQSQQAQNGNCHTLVTHHNNLSSHTRIHNGNNQNDGGIDNHKIHQLNGDSAVHCDRNSQYSQKILHSSNSTNGSTKSCFGSSNLINSTKKNVISNGFMPASHHHHNTSLSGYKQPKSTEPIHKTLINQPQPSPSPIFKSKQQPSQVQSQHSIINMSISRFSKYSKRQRGQRLQTRELNIHLKTLNQKYLKKSIITNQLSPDQIGVLMKYKKMNANFESSKFLYASLSQKVKGDYRNYVRSSEIIKDILNSDRMFINNKIIFIKFFRKVQAGVDVPNVSWKQEYFKNRSSSTSNNSIGIPDIENIQNSNRADLGQVDKFSNAQLGQNLERVDAVRLSKQMEENHVVSSNIDTNVNVDGNAVRARSNNNQSKDNDDQMENGIMENRQEPVCQSKHKNTQQQNQLSTYEQKQMEVMEAQSQNKQLCQNMQPQKQEQACKQIQQPMMQQHIQAEISTISGNTQGDLNNNEASQISNNTQTLINQAKNNLSDNSSILKNEVINSSHTDQQMQVEHKQTQRQTPTQSQQSDCNKEKEKQKQQIQKGIKKGNKLVPMVKPITPPKEKQKVAFGSLFVKPFGNLQPKKEDQKPKDKQKKVVQAFGKSFQGIGTGSVKSLYTPGSLSMNSFGKNFNKTTNNTIGGFGKTLVNVSNISTNSCINNTSSSSFPKNSVQNQINDANTNINNASQQIQITQENQKQLANKEQDKIGPQKGVGQESLKENEKKNCSQQQKQQKLISANRNQS